MFVGLLSVFGSTITSCSKDDVELKDGPTGPKVDLMVSSTIDNKKPEVDGYVTYTITAKNIGPVAATQVAVADTLPEGLELVSSTTKKGSYDLKTSKWTIGDFAKDSTYVLLIKAKVISYGNITNSVSIDGKITDPNLQNNSSKTLFSTSLVGLSKEQVWSFDVYANMKEIYLWDDALPKAFDPRKYATPGDALNYLTALKINPTTSKPIDHYTFLDKIGNLSGEIGGGVASGDYGFMVTAALNESKTVSFYVTYVYKGSPAGDAGVKRSYEVVRVNGSAEVHPEVSADGYLVSTSIGYTNVANALFNSASATFAFKKNDGTLLEAPMTAKSYELKSVLKDSVYTVGAKKVGYVVFNQFLGASSVTELNTVVRRFETENVKYVVVDLRYNGGGAVSTSAAFCNMLAPASANGKVMFYYKMNALLTAQVNPASVVANIAKTNSLEPTEIYFIVGGGTASASELLINNLKPYYPGKLFLIGKTTYGKPCGFWATPIGYDPKQTTPKEGYDLYAVSFETVNANKEGGYYTGMTPSISVNDMVGYQWGDTNDPRLGQALYHITNGAFNTTKSSVSKNQALKTDIDRQFKGMIDFRKHLK